MPEYLHPGVYIEETSFRAKPIEGVSTSTAGLVGRTRKGPEGNATLVTSFTEFTRTFGDPYPVPTQLGDYLGHAVRAFFENGGLRAYIVRTLADDAKAADTVLLDSIGMGVVARLPATATVIGPASTLPLNSLRGIGMGTQIQIWARGTTTTPATLRYARKVVGYDAMRNTVTLDIPIPTGATLSPSSTFVVVVGTAPQTGHISGPSATALYRGLGGNDVAVEIRPSESPPTKLATRKFGRARPIVTTLAGTGPSGAGATTFTMTGADAAALRIGDTIQFTSGVSRTITAIDTGTLVTSAAQPGAAAPTPIHLVQRGATAAPSPITVYQLVGAETIAAGSPVAAPHGVVAALRAGDSIEIAGTPLTVAAGTGPAATPTITFTPALSAGEDFSSSTVRLVATAQVAGNTTTRLVVGDTTGLDTPYRTPTFEPIAITAGGTVDGSVIELVDTSTGQLFVSLANPPVPGSGTYPDHATNATWASLEDLQLIGTGPLAMTIPVISTSGFYTGGMVEVDDGNTKTYRVITAIDVGNRTLTVGTALSQLDAATDPAQRRAYVRTIEMDVLVYERDASGKPVLKETFAGLSWNPDTNSDAALRYYMTKINDRELGSGLIRMEEPVLMPPPLDPTGQPMTDDGFLAFLTGGDDGSPLANIDLVGHDNGPGQRTGIQALSERRDIALVAVPGVTDELVQEQLITHCELLRYRFAILDGRPSVPQVPDILAHRNNYDTEYAAYYEPWLSTVDLTTGKTILVPPSGYVLGICARVDNERGVFKAPANEVVRGILDVELPFTDGEQDVLNPLGVNLIRQFEGRGIRVWGARTLSSDAEWKYVNVRRLFIFLEHSIDNGTQWVVFEPNNEALWARVKATIESFLFGVWKTGALMGTKPEDAYFVRCDRTTMTQDDLDNGRLICLIGVAPTYPAEFVIFRIGQFTASSNVA